MVGRHHLLLLPILNDRIGFLAKLGSCVLNVVRSDATEDQRRRSACPSGRPLTGGVSDSKNLTLLSTVSIGILGSLYLQPSRRITTPNIVYGDDVRVLPVRRDC